MTPIMSKEVTTMNLNKMTSAVLFVITVLLGVSCTGLNTKTNILVAVPFTGDAASYGNVQKQGIEIAMSELNGDPVAKKMNIIYADTKMSPREITNVLQQEMAKNPVSVVMPITTAETMAIAPICNENKIVLLSPLASGDQITSAGEYVYRVSPTDSYQGRELARVVYEDKNRTASVLFVNDSWGKGLSDVFVQSFTSMGGNVRSVETCISNQTDLRTQLAKIKQSKSDALVLIVHPGEAIPALTQKKELGIRSKIYGGDTFSHKTIYTEALDVAQGVVFTLPATPNNDTFRKLSAEYKTRFGTDADINAAAARDAIMLIAEAVRSGATDGKSIKDRFDKLSEGIIGATGLIKWDKNGDVISKHYASYKIKGDTYEPYEPTGK